MNEHQINVLHDSWLSFRFVRQAAEMWPHAYRPIVRGGPFGTIIVAYAVLNSRGQNGPFGRYWYVMASPDVVDGMQMDPADVADPHDGLPVVPRTVHSNEVPMPYYYLPDVELATERERRAAHVGYWELQRKLNPPTQQPQPGLLAKLFSRS